MINLSLARKRGLDDEDIMQIQLLQRERETLIDEMQLTQGTDVGALGYYGDLLAILEKQLQGIWKLDEDLSYTRFWELPHCTCPAMDNEDRMGANAGSIISGGCPVHGHRLQVVSNAV